MALPTLTSLTAKLDEMTAGLLGDPFDYDGLTFFGFVDYGEENRQAVGAIEQDMFIQVRVVDVPVRPNADNRIVLPKKPGKSYKPVNVTLDDGGTWWVFSLKEIKL
jgi:hypothetical protein